VSNFRLVILSKRPPRHVVHLLERFQAELPKVCVSGIIYERPRHTTMGQRLRDILHRLFEPHYLPFAFNRSLRLLSDQLRRFGEAFLLSLHACPRNPNGTLEMTLEGLERFGKEHGCAFHATVDMHAPEALAFARECQADLGILYGTPLIKPELFQIPRLGCINLHKRKLPDYRGGGPVGLWELLDGRTEIGISVHQVSHKLHAGPIVRSASIPIDPFDDLESLALKAEVVGDDTLVAAVRDFTENTIRVVPQDGTGRMFRAPSEQLMLVYRRRLPGIRFRAARTRPMWKLLLRAVLFSPWIAVRNWSYRRRSAFPIVILYHHLITDRPHHLGMPTSAFARQARFLRKYYRVASLNEAMCMLEQNCVPEPTVVLTFDDGYAENYVNLRAVANEYRLPVFSFVSTGHMTDQSPFDHDLKRGQEDFKPLTWEQVKHLRQMGYSFGCHTRSHFDCGSIDPDQLADEIVGSKRELDSQLGESIAHFSFPWGMAANMSEPAQKLAHQIFPYVFAASGGVNPPGQAPRFSLLKRCSHPASIWDLELLSQGVLEFGKVRDLFVR
jgi:peptidoglycan/xylan/chitin deacetylase (PgdA/CDA1 family)/folate-dependent phosphoribosylglycinamide formyltransferase PurN